MIKTAAQFDAIVQRAVLSGAKGDHFIYGVGTGPDGKLSSTERPASAEVRAQVAAKIDLLVRNRLDRGVPFPPVTEAELRKGETPAAKAYAKLVKTAVADAYNDRERQALTFFIKKGWQPHQAVAIVASLKKKNFLDPGAVQGGGGPGRGIAQWTDRDSRTATYAKLNSGKKLLDATFAEQLSFVNYELNNPVLSKDKTLTDRSYKAVGNELRNSADLATAVAVVVSGYERPRSKNQVVERLKTAETIYRYWKKQKMIF